MARMSKKSQLEINLPLSWGASISIGARTPALIFIFRAERCRRIVVIHFIFTCSQGEGVQR